MDRESDDSLPGEWGREFFLLALLRDLTGTLEGIIGFSDAEGFISVVGQRIGDRMNEFYKKSLGTEKIERARIAETLVDLKRRIQGDFYVEEESEERIVLGNRRCPFGEFVEGRPSLCMMTSNVFGTIAAENLGYARVTLEETIAAGHGRCRAVIELTENLGESNGESREYFALSGQDVER